MLFRSGPDIAAGEARSDAAGAEGTATPGEVIAFVGVWLGGPLGKAIPWLTHGSDHVDGADQGLAVATVRADQGEGERRAAPICH